MQKHILQQRKPTNTGPVLIKLQCQCNEAEIIVITPGAQDPNLKSQPDFFKFFHGDSVPLSALYEQKKKKAWNSFI